MTIPSFRCLLMIGCGFVVVSESAVAQQTSQPDRPQPITVRLDQIAEPTADQRTQVEKWLLDIELVPLMADRVGFTATGTMYIQGNVAGKPVANYRHFAIAFALDNRDDSERIMVINQGLLQPQWIDQDKWRMMNSDTAQLDRLRLEQQYHEQSGSNRYAPSKKSRIQGQLEGSSAFFPTRAALAAPATTWAGRSMDRSTSQTRLEHLVGFQQTDKQAIAMFESRPADYYRYYRAISFRDGVPIQSDNWRAFRRKSDVDRKSPSKKEIAEERSRLLESATHVSRIQSRWKTIGKTSVPIWILATTLNDKPESQIEAEIRWLVNDQISNDAFQVESVGNLGPFEIEK